MIVPNNCCGCSACVNVCPKKCLAMERDVLGFLYPKCNENLCINCKLCDTVCPSKSKKVSIERPYAWGGYNSDQGTRNRSSSGGIFSLLAEDVLCDGGIVVGAALSEDCRSVNHIIISNAKELYKLRGSKYLQSNMRNVFTDIKDYLENGKKVLFSGTPCQVDGLRLFLKKEYDNLLLVEIICHGVPSPKLYSKYIDHIKTKLGSQIRNVFFRDEKSGGGGY